MHEQINITELVNQHEFLFIDHRLPISPTKVGLEVWGVGGREKGKFPGPKREKGKLPTAKREKGKERPAEFEIQFH